MFSGILLKEADAVVIMFVAAATADVIDFEVLSRVAKTRVWGPGCRLPRHREKKRNTPNKTGEQTKPKRWEKL
jgi:hypothetical protein